MANEEKGNAGQLTLDDARASIKTAIDEQLKKWGFSVIDPESIDLERPPLDSFSIDMAGNAQQLATHYLNKYGKPDAREGAGEDPREYARKELNRMKAYLDKPEGDVKPLSDFLSGDERLPAAILKDLQVSDPEKAAGMERSLRSYLNGVTAAATLEAIDRLSPGGQVSPDPTRGLVSNSGTDLPPL